MADPAEPAPRAEAAHVLLAFEAPGEILELQAHLVDIVSAEPRAEVVVAEAQADVPPVDFELAQEGAREKFLGVA